MQIRCEGVRTKLPEKEFKKQFLINNESGWQQKFLILNLRRRRSVG